MGKNKLLAGLAAGALVTSVVAATTMSPTSAAAGGGGNDAVFTPGNPGPFTIIDTTAIAVGVTPQNAGGVVTDVNVTLNDVGHTWPDDIDLELVSPTGIAVPLMSDQCGSTDVEDVDWTFDDEAGAAMADGGPCNSGSYKPGNVNDGTDSWPVSPTATTLSAFDGTNPNGSWTLRLVDDASTDVGDMEGGFTLTIVTAPFSILIPGTGSNGPAAPNPFTFTVTGQPGKVADVNLVLGKFTHEHPDDLDFLLVAPNGAKALVMSDACGGTDLTELTFTVDDEAAAAFPDSGPCPSGSYKPADYATGDVLPAPAPAGPYTTALSVFDGIDPNGIWSLYVNDDAAADNGFLSEDPKLVIGLTDTTPPDTLLQGKKPENTTKTKVKIKFTSNEAGVTFQCKLDSGKYKPCSSPFKAKNLKVGKHKVFVVATDAAGNKDPKPLKVKWKVFPKN